MFLLLIDILRIYHGDPQVKKKKTFKTWKCITFLDRTNLVELIVVKNSSLKINCQVYLLNLQRVLGHCFFTSSWHFEDVLLYGVFQVWKIIQTWKSVTSLDVTHIVELIVVKNISLKINCLVYLVNMLFFSIVTGECLNSVYGLQVKL